MHRSAISRWPIQIACASALAFGGLLCGATNASADAFETSSTDCYWQDGLAIYYNSVDSSGRNQGSAAEMCNNVYNYAGYSYSPNPTLTIHVAYVFTSTPGGSVDVFSTGGAGYPVKNNAASVLDLTSGPTARNYNVFYYSGYGGHVQTIRWSYYGTVANLDSTLKNNNASQTAWA